MSRRGCVQLKLGPVQLPDVGATRTPANDVSGEKFVSAITMTPAGAVRFQEVVRTLADPLLADIKRYPGQP